MPKFEFSLEAVLTQRKHAEQERQRALGTLLTQMNTWETELRELDATNKTAGDELRSSRLTGQIDLAFLAAHRRFVLSTERKARTLIQKMALLHRQIEEARGLLLESARKRKVVEKLRDRQLEQWRAELLRKDQAEIDEVGGTLTIAEWQQEAREATRR